MSVNVMIVDDSAIIRGLITRLLESDPALKVVASAADGMMAVDQAKIHQPDVIVLDIEMPNMDGLTALPLLLEAAPKTRVIMSSTLTQRNASISMDALARGASDCVAKPSARTAADMANYNYELLNKVRALAGLEVRPLEDLQPAPPESSAAAPVTRPVVASFSLPTPTVSNAKPTLLPETSSRPTALAIASSTGGPQALLHVFSALKGKLLHLPIFITQHMPATFTALLAEQIQRACDRPSAEAREGDIVQPGCIYIAPGDYHMTVQRIGDKAVLHLNQNPPVNFCRPAADPMLDSLARAYGANLLVAVLTGMGHDGLDGCKNVVQSGGAVIAQDQASSVVWGMPRAVAEGNLCQAVLPLDDIAPYLIKRCG